METNRKVQEIYRYLKTNEWLWALSILQYNSWERDSELLCWIIHCPSICWVLCSKPQVRCSILKYHINTNLLLEQGMVQKTNEYSHTLPLVVTHSFPSQVPVWIRKKYIFRASFPLLEYGDNTCQIWHSTIIAPQQTGTEQLTQPFGAVSKPTAISGHRILAPRACGNPVLIPSIFLVTCSCKYKTVSSRSIKDRFYDPWKLNSALQLLKNQVKNFFREYSFTGYT